MKTNPIFNRAFLAACLLLGAAGLIAADDAAAPASAQDEAAKPAKPGIAKGMTAEEVRKIIGEPKAIKRLDSAAATGVEAENWIYRRKMRSETTQDPVKTETQRAFIGVGMGDENGLGTVLVPVYRMKHTTLFQVTALLMVDGTLIEARQWVETEVNYEG